MFINTSLRRFVFQAALPCVIISGFAAAVPRWTLAAQDDDWPVSCFCYRDTNRNGIYDLPDRPFAGLTIELVRPNGSTVRKQSNISGFANFRSSATKRPVEDIHSAGMHQFRALIPDDLQLTSGNSTQSIAVLEQPKITGGLALETTCTAFGVAPQLTISGKVAGSPGPSASITATNAGGETLSVKPEPDGAFSIPSDAGFWNISFEHLEVSIPSRKVIVENYPVRISAPSTGKSLPSLGSNRMVSFDDLTTSDTLHEIPAGYGGLGWQNWVATHQKLYDGHGYVNATTSGEYAAYASSGYPATISSERPFDVVGFNIGVAWPQGEEEDIVIRAWRSNSQIHEDRLRAKTTGPVWFDAQYNAITRLEISHESFERIVIDDFRYRIAE